MLTRLSNSLFSWSLSHEQQVRRSWGLLPIYKVVLQLLLAAPGHPHSCQQSLWCFDLRQRHSFRAYAWPLWFVCCGSVVIDVIYSTVENPRSLTDQRPEEKHAGRHWQFVKRRKILFPAGNPSLGLWTQAASQSSSSAVKWEHVMHKHKPDRQRSGGPGRFSKAASMCRRRCSQPGLLLFETPIS